MNETNNLQLKWEVLKYEIQKFLVEYSKKEFEEIENIIGLI